MGEATVTATAGWGGRPSYWRTRPRPPDPFFLNTGGEHEQDAATCAAREWKKKAEVRG